MSLPKINAASSSFLAFSLVFCLLIGWMPLKSAQADTLPQLENDLKKTSRDLRHQEQTIEQAEKNLDAARTRSKNARDRYEELKIKRKYNPESSSIATATDRAFDQVIRTEKAEKEARSNLKKEKNKLYDLREKEEGLKTKVKKIKTTTPSLDEIIMGTTIPGFYEGLPRSRYKNKANESNKEDESIESEQKGGVTRGEGSGSSSPMMSYP